MGIAINWFCFGQYPPLMAFFAIIEHIFFRLKAMAKKARSISTLSIPKCRKRLYAMSYFICPKTASGSMHRLPRYLIPSSDVSLSPAFLRYSFSR